MDLNSILKQIDEKLQNSDYVIEIAYSSSIDDLDAIKDVSDNNYKCIEFLPPAFLMNNKKDICVIDVDFYLKTEYKAEEYPSPSFNYQKKFKKIDDLLKAFDKFNIDIDDMIK